MQKRKDEVSGTDDLGDVPTLATDDLKRAEEVAAIISEDLEGLKSMEVADT